MTSKMKNAYHFNAMDTQQSHMGKMSIFGEEEMSKLHATKYMCLTQVSLKSCLQNILHCTVNIFKLASVPLFSETLTWSRPKATGMVPAARDGHTACIINNRMYVFGGYEEGIERFSNDVYYLDLATMKWHYVMASVSFATFFCSFYLYHEQFWKCTYSSCG